MTPEQTAALLGRLELFGALDGPARLELARRSPQRRFGRGQTILLQGEPGDSMFVLLDGEVRFLVRSNRGEVVELNRHGPPATFGELAVLDGGPRSVSVEAVKESTALVVSRVELVRLVHAHAEVADGLLKTLGALVRRATTQVTNQVFLDVEGRVAAKLLDLAVGLGGGRLVPRISQSDLAAMVGASRGGVNEVLGEFRRLGYIRVLPDRSVEILRRDKLERRATI